MRTVLLALLAIMPAMGDVIYTYTGNNFDTISGEGGPTTADRLTLSFITPGRFPANSSATIFATWTISDGVSVNVCQYNLNLGGFYSTIQTDGSGNIAAWNFICSTQTENLTTFGSAGDGIDSVNVVSRAQFPPISFATASSSTLGTWTITETPEPVSILLFGAGLITVWCRSIATKSRRGSS